MFPVFGVYGRPASRVESGGGRERETAFSPKEIWVKTPIFYKHHGIMHNLFYDLSKTITDKFMASENIRDSMERIPVSSRNLHSVGYDPTTNELEIEFNSGGIYVYDNVPASEYHQLMNPPGGSHGTHFADYIKNVYHFRRIR